MDIKFYYVNPEYIEFLKSAEIKSRGFTCVPNVSYANREKFFYGTVLTKKDGINYFVPISSQIKKDANTIIIKTNDKVNREKGSLRFAYMIPVPHKMLEEVDFKAVNNKNRQRILQKELAFCRKNRNRIFKQASKTLNDVINATSKKLKNNSCDFKLLEQAYKDFCVIHKLDIPEQNKAEQAKTKSAVQNHSNSKKNKPKR